MRSFFLCYPVDALEGSISTVVSKKLNNFDSNNGMQINKKKTKDYYTKEIESTVDIHGRNTMHIYIYIYI